MVGQIIYKDGIVEPILKYIKINNYIEVTAPSGKYSYEPFLDEVAGYLYSRPAFYYYDKTRDRWFLNNNIKAFQIYKENKNEYNQESN